MIDVIIASDIRIYCEGLGQILSSTGDVNVLGTADNCEAANKKISAVPPDILLLDMTMVGSYQLARQIPQVSPETKIVALVVSYDESNIVRCAEVGVTCYVPREASGNELIEAIREGVRGECYCPSKIAACLLKKVQHLAFSSESKKLTSAVNNLGTQPERSGDRQTRLTRRELQIAHLLAEGMSNKQIARDLSIEVSTVKNHVHNVLVKLEVSTRGQAVFYLQETPFPVDLNLSN